MWGTSVHNNTIHCVTLDPILTLRLLPSCILSNVDGGRPVGNHRQVPQCEKWIGPCYLATGLSIFFLDVFLTMVLNIFLTTHN